MDITLKIGNKELRCSLGLSFLGELIDVTDLSIDEIGAKITKNPFKLIPIMLYVSHRTACDLEGAEADIDLKGVISLLEKNGGISNAEVNRFLSSWTKSMTEGVPEVESDGEAKKK